MNPRSIVLVGLFMGVAGTSYGYSGFTGHQLSGALEANPAYLYSSISEPQNSSNLGTPLARVGSDTELSADFHDWVPQQWHFTADFQDNYQVVLRETSPTSQANLGAGDWMVRWHFSGFDFNVGDVQLVLGPGWPWDSALVSFDAQNVWIGFNHFYEIPDRGTYAFQIVPVPEPATAGLLGLGALVCLIRRRVGN